MNTRTQKSTYPLILSDRQPFAGISFRGIYKRSWKTFAKDIWNEMNNDDVFNGAASMAFYFTFAIFPALIFLLGVLPYLPIPNMQATVMDFLNEYLPGDSATLVRNTVLEIVGQKKESILSIGALLTIWAASSGAYALMQQLDITYGVRSTRPYWKSRLIAFQLVVSFAVLTTIALAAIMGGDALQKWLSTTWIWNSTFDLVYSIVRWLLVAAAWLANFSLVFYYGPDVRQKYRFITPGSVVAVVLLSAASLLFKAYIENFGNYNATYGSLGAVIVLMLWLNIMGVVLLLGSEVNSLLDAYCRGEDAESKTRLNQPAKAS